MHAGHLSTLCILGTLGGALLQPRFGQFGAHRAAPLIGSVSRILLFVATAVSSVESMAGAGGMVCYAWLEHWRVDTCLQCACETLFKI